MADEKNHEIEIDFMKSWDNIEQHFYKFRQFEGWDFLIPMESMISELRKMGYDKKLRAGQSIYYLILSRAKYHGLRKKDSSLAIMLSDKDMRVLYRTNETEIDEKFDKIRLNPRLIELIELLANQPIDDNKYPNTKDQSL